MNTQFSNLKIRKNFHCIMLLLGSFALFTHCQEPYFNNDLNADLKIPVFNGVLSNVDNLNTFELYYAMPYPNQRMEAISGAIITLTINNNGSFQLIEKSTGIYKLPDEQFYMEPNQIFTASIQLPNGEMLQSDPAIFYDTLSISSLFFDFNMQTTVVKNSDGTYANITTEGVAVQFRTEKPNDQVAYYRMNANYYVHSQKWVNQTRELILHEPNWDIVYEIQYDTLYDIYEGYTNTAFPEIGELQPYLDYSKSDLTYNPLFLPADRECRNFTPYTSNTFIEWVVPVDLYRNSQDVYRYYSNAAKQLTASGQIFDPIPDQIVGNIHNMTHPNEAVLGIFEVSSVNRKYIAIYVHEALGYRSYQSRILTDTVIKQGWYPQQIFIDTVFVDSLAIEGLRK